MNRTVFFPLCLLVVVSMLIAACSAPAAAPPAQQLAPTQTSVAASGAVNGSAAGAPAPGSAEALHLKPGKPYNGTQITFLLCCAGTPQFASWEGRSARFTELTGIQVKFTYEPWGSYQSRIVTESVAGTGSADVITWLDTFGPSIQKALVPLEPLIKSDGVDYADDYPPAFKEAGIFNNHIYGLPVRTHAFVLFYRKDVFQKLGLAMPKTWDDVLADGKTIKAKTNMAGIANYYAVSAGQALYPWALMLWGEGGDFFDKDFHPIFNNEAGVRATQRYMSLRDIGQQSQFSSYEGMARDSVVTGESAMIVGWWWFYSYFNDPKSAAPEVAGNMAFAPVPALDGKEPVGFALSFPIGISSFSKKQDAAWEFIKWLTNPATDKAVVMDKSDPATSEVAASHISVLKDPEANATNGGLYTAALPALMKSRLMPLIPEWAEVSTILDVAINKIAMGADTKTTLDKAAADVEAVMSRAGYYKK